MRTSAADRQGLDLPGIQLQCHIRGAHQDGGCGDVRRLQTPEGLRPQNSSPAASVSRMASTAPPINKYRFCRFMGSSSCLQPTAGGSLTNIDEKT